MKKKTKNVLRTVASIIAAIIVIAVAALLIDGRSPQAIIVSHSLTQSTMEDYEQAKGDTTDQSTVEIPSDVQFPRPVRQYRVGGMQVFHWKPRTTPSPSCFTSMAVPICTTSAPCISRLWLSGLRRRAVAS